MIVVFDTNAYRNFVKGKSIENIKQEITEIRTKEKQKRITAYLHTTVGMELLGNLYETNGTLFQSCMKASAAMYLHCSDSNAYRIMSLHEVQLCRDFFHVEDIHSICTQKVVGSILYQISQNPTQDTVNKNIENIKRIKLFIDKAEESSAKEIEDFIKNIDPTSTDWQIFKNDKNKRRQYLSFIRSSEFENQTSYAMLCIIYNYCQLKKYNMSSIELDKIDNMVKAYKESHMILINFRRKYFESLVGSNFNFREKSRINFIWDEKILSIVGRTLESKDILLVTSDRWMHDAAKIINPNSKIMNYQEYINFLGL